MNREQIIRMAREAEHLVIEDYYTNGPVRAFSEAQLERFATLVAEHERKQIIASNAPEIEKINAHIKALEVAVLEEREACAKIGDDHVTWSGRAISATIRARGQV